MKSLLRQLRVLLFTLLVCSAAYPLFVYATGRVLTPETANGSLLRDASGRVVGSRLIAQSFTRPEYFWPRPSAVNYDASAAGGSNLAPANSGLTARAEELVARHAATSDNPLPADLVTASGAGLDPHITEAAARFQIPRVAAARNLPTVTVTALVSSHAHPVLGPLDPSRIVNVLELNLALDALNVR